MYTKHRIRFWMANAKSLSTVVLLSSIYLTCWSQTWVLYSIFRHIFHLPLQVNWKARDQQQQKCTRQRDNVSKYAANAKEDILKPEIRSWTWHFFRNKCKIRANNWLEWTNNGAIRFMLLCPFLNDFLFVAFVNATIPKTHIHHKPNVSSSYVNNIVEVVVVVVFWFLFLDRPILWQCEAVFSDAYSI